MHTLKAALFDLDGTLIDTEGQYTEFWGGMGRTYLPHIPTFAHDIKGTTLTQIFDRYFPDAALRQALTQKLDEWEARMDYPFIAGAEDFLDDLKKHGICCAVVTSSNQKKLNSLKARHPQFLRQFDHVLTAEHFRASKPAPDCYLQAAEVCGAGLDECAVFEDALNGIEAGRRAGIMTIGLCTTNPASQIQPLCDSVISDFRGMTTVRLTEMLNQHWGG